MKKFLFSLLFLFFSLTSIAQSFMVPVTLQVDINQIENIGTNIHVHVASNVMSWSSTPMDDSDGDGIFEKTIFVGAASGQETEFVYAFQLQSTMGMLINMQWEGNEDSECLYDGSDDGYGGFGKVRKLIVPTEVPSNFIVSTCWNECTSICEPDPIPGCIDVNAVNYDANATVQGFDQYGNLQCIYTSCDDIPEYGCIYADGFGPFNQFFDAVACLSYGGTPCEEAISGCTDEVANNYNPDATVDDGSCGYEGSTRPVDSVFVDCDGIEAPENWLGDGFCDDGSYTWNGNPIHFDCEEFNWDEGDCPLPQEGCTDPNYVEFNPSAQIDDGSCITLHTPGCVDSLALNYNPNATQNDGSCDYPLEGCTNPEAINYNPLAVVDNGSCANVACDDGYVKMLLEVTLDQYPGETGWILTDITTGQAVASVQAGEYSFNQANTTIPYQLCVPESGVELILSDSYGDGMNGSQWGGSDGNFVILGDLEPCGSPDIIWELPSPDFGNAAYSGPIWLEECEIESVYGCTDLMYQEYNIEADLDDGSCVTPHIIGCIDWTAFNYNPEATLNDIVSVCNYTLVLEDDAADGWGESYIAVSQGDNILGIYTIGPGIYSQEFDLVLETNKPVDVYYFELGQAQQPQEEVEFQTLHNSFELYNSDGVFLIDGGSNPFADNGAGALQPFEPPFWNVYSAMPYCGDYCIATVEGCMNEEAFNYNVEANVNDGSCIEIVYGCTNDLAFNYNPLANVDNGLCEAFVYGCMDNIAWNYNALANVEDESCLYFGCTDIEALNYDETANVDNGACIYPILGCTNPNAFNYDVDANTDDGSCIPEIYGCMDPTMWNYNELANMPSDNCIPFVFGCTDSTAFNFDPIANTDNESCIPVTPGCTDPNAFNYNPDANEEDFSCIDVIYGCTDPNAFNFDSNANTDNGSCIDVVEGCTDVLAYNYNANVNVDDGSCLYDAGCITGPGNPYWLNDSCYAWVIVVDSYCCEDQWDDKCQSLYDYCNEEYSIGIDDLRDNEILIYPNPTSDIVNILAKNDIKINVTNLLGENILTIKNQNQIDLSRFSNGIYILNITYNNMVIQHKIVKN